MKQFSLSILLLIFSLSAIGKSFIRYNVLGYEPERNKRLIIQSDSKQNGIEWEIVGEKVVLSGSLKQSVTGIGPHMPKPFNYEVNFSKLKTEGTYTFKLATGESAPIIIKKQPYAFIPGEILRYFRVMRSGTTTALDHKASHSGDISCSIYKKTDRSNTSWKEAPGNKKVDMLGGWYDAGDYIKFTLTTAYSTYMMLLAYDMNPALFKEQKNYSKSDLNDLLDEAQWGLKYLMKTMPDADEFIIQVGGPDDHKQGERMPNHDALDGKRQAYSAFSPTQMGYTAAALALGAKIFKNEGLEKQSKSYEEMAIKIFDKATNFSSPAWVEEGWEKFYFDQSIHDNMELAAFELYSLTDDKRFLQKGRTYADKAEAAYWYSWGSANMIAHNRIIKKHPLALDYLMTDLDGFQGISKEENNLWHMPHKYTWSTLYSYLGVANSAMLYQLNKKGKAYSEIPLNVLDYTLGMNNWGIAMVASKKIPNSIQNVYSQIYWLKPKLFPTGAVAEGPGDRATHDRLKKYFQLPETTPFDEFNTKMTVFYDYSHDFQTMETTICGLSDGLLFFTLMSKLYAE